MHFVDFICVLIDKLLKFDKELDTPKSKIYETFTNLLSAICFYSSY